MDFDFTQEVEFKVKTKNGETIIREPSGPEYMEYLKKLSKGEDGEQIHKMCVSYLASLGGDEKILNSLPYKKLSQVVKAVNSEDADPK